MADFTFDGRVKVKTLKDEFKKNFGATLRVYTNIACEGEQAADDATDRVALSSSLTVFIAFLLFLRAKATVKQ